MNYPDPQGDTHVWELGAGRADPAEAQGERQLPFVDQAFANHDRGGLASGNDGMPLSAF